MDTPTPVCIPLSPRSVLVDYPRYVSRTFLGTYLASFSVRISHFSWYVSPNPIHPSNLRILSLTAQKRADRYRHRTSSRSIASVTPFDFLPKSGTFAVDMARILPYLKRPLHSTSSATPVSAFGTRPRVLLVHSRRPQPGAPCI